MHTFSQKIYKSRKFPSKPGIKADQICVFHNNINETKTQDCCFALLCCLFSRFIYNAACIILQGSAFGGRGACLSWYHSSIIFPSGSQGPLEREEVWGSVGSLKLPPLWPLTAPSNERRHSHSEELTPRWSFRLSFPAPFSSGRQSTRATRRGMLLSPSWLLLLSLSLLCSESQHPTASNSYADTLLP